MNPGAPERSLCEALGIDQGTRVVALVGGGGKTTLMYCLAGELRSSGRRTVTTTTTKILPPFAHQSPSLLLLAEDPSLRHLDEELSRHGHVTVGEALLDSGKIGGISDETIRHCLDHVDVVLVEADGAAGRPIKAPEEWEPVIPLLSDLVVPVVGLDCVGRPATEHSVFRLERFLSVTGMVRGEAIGPWSIGMLLGSRAGGMKVVPPGARVVPFLNKLDLLDPSWDRDELAAEVLRGAGGCPGRLVMGTLLPQPNFSLHGPGVETA